MSKKLIKNADIKNILENYKKVDSSENLKELKQYMTGYKIKI